jgi:hypothetical protein
MSLNVGVRRSHSGEGLGTAVILREWIQHLHVRFSEIMRVSGDDDEIVNKRGCGDQTVLYRHRFMGPFFSVFEAAEVKFLVDKVLQGATGL